MVVSSANNIDLQYDKGLGMSLEYNMNKRGHRTDPCGTPKDMISVSELVLSTNAESYL